MVDRPQLVAVGLGDHTNGRADKLNTIRVGDKAEATFNQASVDLAAQVLNVIRGHG